MSADAAVEIERKFLVERPAELPDDLGRHLSERIDQGYIALEEGVEVRVRRRGTRAFLTIKSSGARTRLEEELEIDDARFGRLWPLTEGRRVRKTRTYVPIGDGLTVELDVYAGAHEGLVVAEVEFTTEPAADAFEPPPWLGREVTDDPRYKNRALALDGAPPR